MPRYTKQSLEQLRDKVDLVDLISSYVPLKRMGATHKGLCPFHDEKTPSFIVQPGTNHYHCFGCQAHGDAIQFLMQHLKMSFQDAVVTIAERYNIILEEEHTKEHAPEINRKRLKELNEEACSIFQSWLSYADEANEAAAYLVSRGLTNEFVEQFRIGLAPRKEGILRELLHDAGFSEEEMLNVGVLRKTSDNRVREFFCDRITFPIHDAQGNILGFSARKYKEETFGGKYINTSETTLFKKSKILFGANYSRKRIAKEREAILVEGQLDALQMINHGFDKTIAPLGTAFGAQHVQELERLGVRRVYLFFDNDDAGKAAALKAGDLCIQRGIEVRVVQNSLCKDPDELIQKKGRYAVIVALEQAHEYLTFLFHEHARLVDMSSPAEKQKVLKDIIAQIREWQEPVLIHESIKKIASLANVPENLLTAQDKYKVHFRSSIQGKENKKESFDPDWVLEVELLRYIVQESPTALQIVHLCEANLSLKDFTHDILASLYAFICVLRKNQKPVDFITIAAEFQSEHVEQILEELIRKKIGVDKLEVTVQELLLKIKNRNWIRAREMIKTQIHSAKDEQTVMNLVRSFDQLAKNPPTLEHNSSRSV